MDSANELSLQEKYAPQNNCFGCGPTNEKGLRIRSFERGDEYVCTFRPEPHHNAFQGVLSGGICGTLLDCHSNWAACTALMKASGATEVPCTVTADYSVKLKRPTPMDADVIITAKVVEMTGDHKIAIVEAKMESKGKVTATCRGTFVAVEPGHPAYHRW